MIPKSAGKAWRLEIGAMIKLAAPLALTQLAYLAMITTDVIFMGWLGQDALAAGVLAGHYFWFFEFAAMGVLAGLGPILSQHVGARRFRRIRPRIESLDATDAREISGGTPPADRSVDARRMLDLCESVIENDLTPLQRRIFHLKHLRRQSIRSIAEALGKSEDAIKANLYRMRRSIAQNAPGLEGILQGS